MLLTAALIADELPAQFKAELKGSGDTNHEVGRPEFHEGEDEPFNSGRLYVVLAERLPARAHAERGATIVCVGSSSRMGRYLDRCNVIAVDGQADFFSVFNAVQRIFDAYDAWERELDRLADAGASIQSMLERSEQVLENPLYAIDSEFRILGASRMVAELPQFMSQGTPGVQSLSLGSFDQFLGMRDLALEEREPLLIELLDTVTLNCNLFEHGEYQGCLTLQYHQRPYRESDRHVLSFLARKVERALRQLAHSDALGKGSLRQAVKDLVEGLPLDAVGRAAFDRAASNRHFICMRLKLSNRLANLPIGYVRNMVETAFPKSLTFEHHKNSIVSFIDLDELDPKLTPKEAIAQAIEPFTSTMGMRAGLSEPVQDIMQARLYYLEANAALENGKLFAKDAPLVAFSDYVLEDMVVSSLGEFPLELLCPQGLRALIEHDAASPTSYIETLKVYLDNNMSVTKTAKLLYVHRSTLIERLARIKRELGLDLEDPDARLLVQMLLKAMQVRDTLATQE